MVHVLGNSALFFFKIDETLPSDVAWGPQEFIKEILKIAGGIARGKISSHAPVLET